MQAEWTSTDPRDSGYDRQFTLVPFDHLSQLRADCWTILYVLTIPQQKRRDVQVIDRVITARVREDARDFVDMLAGANGSDRDRAQNLRNRVDQYRRQFGDLSLMFGVYYSDRLPVDRKPSPKPTPEMLRRVRHELLSEGGLGNVHWRMALSEEELPQAPHERAILAICGVDAKGRINESLPRPNHHQLDRWFRRDLRQLVKAVIAHPAFAETVRFCEDRGLTLCFLWRYESPQRR